MHKPMKFDVKINSKIKESQDNATAKKYKITKITKNTKNNFKRKYF